MQAKSNKSHEQVELGFGTKSYNNNVRFLNKDGTVNVRRKGLRSYDNIDVYHWLITTSWTKLLIVILAFYVLVNTLFACIYFALGYEHFGGIEGFTGPVVLWICSSLARKRSQQLDMVTSIPMPIM